VVLITLAFHFSQLSTFLFIYKYKKNLKKGIYISKSLFN
jgi:hypothetical protein